MAFFRNLTWDESVAISAAVLKHSEAINADLAEYGIEIQKVELPEMYAVTPVQPVAVGFLEMDHAMRNAVRTYLEGVRDSLEIDDDEADQ